MTEPGLIDYEPARQIFRWRTISMQKAPTVGAVGAVILSRGIVKHEFR